MHKELGSGNYQPSVSAHFPKLGRGHSQGFTAWRRDEEGKRIRMGARPCPACKTDAKGHAGAKKNREDWEESVGLTRTSKTTRSANHGLKRAKITSLDPKQLLTTLALLGTIETAVPSI